VKVVVFMPLSMTQSHFGVSDLTSLRSAATWRRTAC